MKKLIAFILLSVYSFATTTITGHVNTLGTGGVTSGAYVRFWLRGCAGNQPRIAGSGLIAPTQGGVFFFDFPVGGTGTISGTLYSNRDATGVLGGEIECGGSTLATWYGMQAFVGGKGGPEVPVYAKNAGTLDIANVTPITTNPVVTSPTGDSSYLRLDGGNSPVTGAVTFNGNVNVGGILQTAYLNAGGWAIPVEFYGAVGDWNGTTGTDNTAAIQACLNALTSGQCLLQAKSYKTTSPLTITKSGVGLIGVESVQPNTTLFPTPSLSTIITTSASADILDISGVSTANSIYGNVVKNLTLARSVVPSGSAKGLSLSYSYKAQISNLVSMDSIYDFYFRGVGSLGFGYVENSAASWGYNGVTETAGSVYGFYTDTTAGIFSPSIRLRNNFVASNLGAGVTTYGFANVGTLNSDWHLFHNETAGLNYGVYVNASGVGFAASSDMEIFDPINDNCVTACIYSTGLTGSMNITGGWANPNGANAVAADFESGAAGSQVSVVNMSVYGNGVTASSGLVIGHNSYNVQVIGSKIRSDSSTVPAAYFSGVVAGGIVANSIFASGATPTLVSLVNTINVPISSNVLNGNSTNGIVLDSATHGISGLETNTCGSSAGVITNCLVDNGSNTAFFITPFGATPVAFASLPTCVAGLEGLSRAVNNSNTAVYNAAVAGAGTNHIVAYCNGTAWVAH